VLRCLRTPYNALFPSTMSEPPTARNVSVDNTVSAAHPSTTTDPRTESTACITVFTWLLLISGHASSNEANSRDSRASLPACGGGGVGGDNGSIKRQAAT
jgi:hypothetical protein